MQDDRTFVKPLLQWYEGCVLSTLVMHVPSKFIDISHSIVLLYVLIIFRLVLIYENFLVSAVLYVHQLISARSLLTATRIKLPVTENQSIIYITRCFLRKFREKPRIVSRYKF